MGKNKVITDTDTTFPIPICDYHLEDLRRVDYDEELEVLGETDELCNQCRADRIAELRQSRKSLRDMPASSLFPATPNPLSQPDPTVSDWGDRDDKLREYYRR